MGLFGRKKQEPRHDWNIAIEQKSIVIGETPASISVIHLSGSLDSFTFDKLERALDKLVAEENLRIVLDMKRMHYISSAGLGVLVRFAKQLRQSEGDLKLAQVPGAVREVLELVSMDAMLDTYKTEAAAVSSFQEV